MKTVRFTPRQIIVTTTVDAMNRYVNQVLIPANIVNEDAWRRTDSGTGSDLCNKKYAIAEDLADKWEKALGRRISHRNIGYVIFMLLGAIAAWLIRMVL